ncbi:MAG: transcription factor S [Candidatus Bathyarchaeia archaeon]
MEFCPNCETRLVLRRKGSRAESGFVLVCAKCGYSKDTEKEELVTARLTDKSPQERIAVIGEQEARIQTMPTAKTECPRCGNREANWWMVQTRGADEAPTQFFRCTQCGYTWREMA